MTRSLPDDFVAMLGQHPQLSGLAEALAGGEPAISVRVNAEKGYAAPPGAAKVAWCDTGVYLDERPRFTFDPALHQGRFYVQEASSMASQQAIREAVRMLGSHEPLRYLDACAAPGGKTLGACAELPADALLVANEYDRRRVAVLTENLTKWGRPGVVVTNADAAAISGLDGFFDIIAADVPCSGEGMMRKEPEAIAQWSPRLIENCAALQRDITENLWEALRPGGFLIYSTCTFNRREDEEVVERLINEFGAEAIPVPALDRPEIERGIGVDFPCYRFLPGRVRGEGLFLALLRKPDGDRPRIKLKKPSKYKTNTAFAPFFDGNFVFSDKSGVISAIPAALAAEIEYIGAKLRVVSEGVEAGTHKGRDLVPSQALALSTALAQGAFPRVDVDAATAIEYLRRNPVALPDSSPKGFVLLTYEGAPLGFVKNIGSRANNLYPAAWRILSQQGSPEKVF